MVGVSGVVAGALFGGPPADSKPHERNVGHLLSVMLLVGAVDACGVAGSGVVHRALFGGPPADLELREGYVEHLLPLGVDGRHVAQHTLSVVFEDSK